ncbi:Cytosolic sulfotransferase 14 [Sesamum angolense]|uniref:Sulfotransferase n=1 Tax=Sesamum angolense TaxID=2727404 RepID=A0AAE1X858_9LAMI|nr:Cytosolic sulfotransferase 14 [Sesamum angolense]
MPLPGLLVSCYSTPAAAISAQKHKPHDIILASLPKTGTTWLKALLFTIVNRDRFPIDQSPLLTTNPHELVLHLESYVDADLVNPGPGNLPQPEVFSTHLPLHVLPSSMIDSTSKIIYTSRNPLDQFISQREFSLKNRLHPDVEPVPIDQAFDMFCKGVHPFGPFWDHILGYWKASLENPDRVLFLQYEDMKRDAVSHVRKIAKFLGLPFSEEEEKKGLIGEISDLCSFEKLKNLEINKNGHVHHGYFANSSFFRKGEIGDWRNHLSPAMAERMKEVMDAKLSGSG